MSLLTDLKMAWTIFLKDLKLELRQKIEFVSMLVFSVSAVLAFAVVLNDTEIPSPELNARIISGSMWIIFLFAGMLSFASLFGREIKSGGGGLTVLRSFPVKPQVLFLGKLFFNLMILLTIELTIIIIYTLFFGLEFKSSFWIIILVLFVATLDYAVVGTLVSAMTIYSRAKTLVIPILIFPLIIPSIMLAVLIITNLILGVMDEGVIRNILLLLMHFIMILVISFLTIETIIQD